MKPKPINKLYYSIKEVSELLDVSDATLRYWEKEFKDLQPRTSPGGTRTYTADDIEYIKLIRHLLKDRKLKIEGARQTLKDNRADIEKNRAIVERLQAVKEELQAMKAELENC